MKNKTLRTVLFVLVAVVLVVCAFGGGIVAGNFINVLKPGSLALLPSITGTSGQPTTTGSSQGGTPTDLQSLFAPFWQAWDLVHQNYVDQPVDNTKLVQGAINGMMAALGDPHTGYSTPQETTDLNNAMTGVYDGIGAYVDTKGTYMTITKPIPGYPAEKAGLQAGDQIIAVDGVDVTGMDPDVVRLTKVMGPAGTNVNLTVSVQVRTNRLSLRSHVPILSFQVSPARCWTTTLPIFRSPFLAIPLQLTSINN